MISPSALSESDSLEHLVLFERPGVNNSQVQVKLEIVLLTAAIWFSDRCVQSGNPFDRKFRRKYQQLSPDVSEGTNFCRYKDLKRHPRSFSLAESFGMHKRYHLAGGISIYL